MADHSQGAQSQENKRKNRKKNKIYKPRDTGASTTGRYADDGSYGSSPGINAPEHKGSSPLVHHDVGSEGKKKSLLPKSGIHHQENFRMIITATEDGRTFQCQAAETGSKIFHNKHSAGLHRRDSSDTSTANSGKQASSTKVERKGGKQNKERLVTPSTKGKFVNLEGQELLRQLADHRIFELRKKNLSFPNANYFCRLCDYHLDKPLDCERHVKESRHRRKKEASDMDGILEHIPKPSPQQIKAVDIAVEFVAAKEGLSPSELEARQNTVCKLQRFLRTFKVRNSVKACFMMRGGCALFCAEDITLHLYGSSFSGVGLKESDVNVDVSGKGPTPSLLIDVYNLIQQKGEPVFVKTQSDYLAKIPAVHATDASTGQHIVLTINSQTAILTSTLLQLYSLADSRVQKLTVILRHWAKICHLDRQEEGTLPPFAFNIMVVYFLQQVSPPVLCVLPLPQSHCENKGSSPMKMEDRVDFASLKKKALAWKSKNHSSLGELWLQMLKFYCLDFESTNLVISILLAQPLTRQEKKWRSKKLAIEDPFAAKKNIASSMGNSLIFEYFESCLRKAYEYFAMPRDERGNVNVSLEALKVMASKKTDHLLKENQEHSFDSSSSFESDKESPPRGRLVNKGKKTKGNKEEERDDDSTQSEVSSGPVVILPNRSIVEKLKALAGMTKVDNVSNLDSGTSARSAEKPLMSEWEVTSESFSPSDCDIAVETLQTSSVSDVTTDSVQALSASELEITTDSASGQSASECCVLTSETDMSTGFVPSISVMAANNVILNKNEKFEASSDNEHDTLSDTHSEKNAYGTNLHIPQPAIDSSHNQGFSSSVTLTADQMVQGSGEITQQENTEKGNSSTYLTLNGEHRAPKSDDNESSTFSYVFTEYVFTSGKGPAVICGYCEQEGHTKANCPDDKLPSVLPLPRMTGNHLKILDKVITQVIYDFSPTDIQVQQRERVVKELEIFVQYVYPDAVFSLFGSSCNGFGFYSSDLDICMTFRGKNVEDIDVAETIETVAKRLLQRGNLYNVISIPTAKVPIVKFTDRETRLEGDISLYNTLALRNTQLLRCYCQIDERVRILGYAIKIFAKVCSIGDASRGGLSSYGYILMMIHYLQQLKPPVLPVLQELHPEGKQPEYMVEDCNTWFFDDLKQLPKVWPHFRKNAQNVGELWLGFLCYYLEIFDWKSMVVTIRQKAPLTKFEKLWTGKTIAVEDPFDLNHNLGGGLSRKMNNYIYKTFVNGRMHFGSPVDIRLNLFSHISPSDYFFAVDMLTDGKPPNDRGCRLCGKIGHLVRDCPNRGGNRRRQQAKKDKQVKQKTVEPEKSTGKKDAREQDKELKGQGLTLAKEPGGEKDPSRSQEKKQGSSHTRGQVESKDQDKTKPKQHEKSKSHGDTHSKGEVMKGQSNGEVRRQSCNQPESLNKVSDDGDGSAGITKQLQQIQLLNEARAVSAVATGTAASTASTTTVTDTLATALKICINMPGVPPGFQSRTISQPNVPLQSSPTAALGNAPERSPISKASSPLRQVKAGNHSTGVQMDLQQLFNMVQQSGSNSPSLPSQFQTQPQSPSGMCPSSPFLTPEQQMARFGGQSPSISHQPGITSPGQGNSKTRMTPVSLESLFQSLAPPGHQVHAASMTQQRTPVSLNSMFQASPQAQLALGFSPPTQGSSETGHLPQQVSQLPLMPLQSASSSQVHKQQLLQQSLQTNCLENSEIRRQLLQNFMQQFHKQPASVPSQSFISIPHHQNHPGSAENQSSSPHLHQMGLQQQQPAQKSQLQLFQQSQPLFQQQQLLLPQSQQTGPTNHSKENETHTQQQHQGQNHFATDVHAQSQPLTSQYPTSTSSLQSPDSSSNMQYVGFPQPQQQRLQKQLKGLEQTDVSLGLHNQSLRLQAQHYQAVELQQQVRQPVGQQAQPMGVRPQHNQPMAVQPQQSQSGGMQLQHSQPLANQSQHSQPMAIRSQQSHLVRMPPKHSQPVGVQSQYSQPIVLNPQHNQLIGMHPQHGPQVGLLPQNSPPKGLQSQYMQQAGLQSQHSQQTGLEQHNNQSMGLQSQGLHQQQNQPMTAQVQQGQALHSQALHHQLAMQQQQMTAAGVYAQYLLTGFPLSQMSGSSQNSRRDGTISNPDATEQGEAHGNP